MTFPLFLGVQPKKKNNINFAYFTASCFQKFEIASVFESNTTDFMPTGLNIHFTNTFEITFSTASVTREITDSLL